MSEYIGDYAEDAIVFFKFNTSGTFAGSPALSVYKDNSTTEITTGITLTVDFDGRDNLHHCTIDLSSDAAYSPGSHYEVVVTNGTVGGESADGQCVRSFSIENLSNQKNLRLGQSYRHTNNATTDTVDVTITETP